MRGRAFGVSVFVAVATLAATGVTSAASAAPRSAARPQGTLVQAHPHAALPLHGGTVDSLNWSGYADTGSGITAVDSTFVVPSAGLVPPGFAATWAGIGGYSTSDLIQAGVGEQSIPSNPLLGPQYYAWYEILPASETPISGCTGDAACTVTPGDTVSVDIHEVSTNTWSISITDSGHWSWTDSAVQYASSESSAEWILEAPTLVVAQTTLPNVGIVHFGPTSTFTDGSGTHTIAGGNPTQIDLSPGLIDEATPSALASDGESFNDCSYAQTCAAP
jgi:hypothetical protein